MGIFDTLFNVLFWLALIFFGITALSLLVLSLIEVVNIVAGACFSLED